eukprot:15248040-Alexandrium_andersonii.AAC.1
MDAGALLLPNTIFSVETLAENARHEVRPRAVEPHVDPTRVAGLHQLQGLAHVNVLADTVATALGGADEQAIVLPRHQKARLRP